MSQVSKIVSIAGTILGSTAVSMMEAKTTDLNTLMVAAGLVDVTWAAPVVKIELMYARNDNFTGVTLYPSGTRAFLHPLAAESLAKAQALLEAEHPGYRIVLRDGARPMSVQRKMFDTVRGTPMAPYVSNPSRGGGLHNFGMAVDVTLMDDKGNYLSMGTPVDHLGPEANINNERALVKSGKITEEERQNRLLLRRVMTEAGFRTLRTEWWHFDRVTRQEARRSYRLLDF